MTKADKMTPAMFDPPPRRFAGQLHAAVKCGMDPGRAPWCATGPLTMTVPIATTCRGPLRWRQSGVHRSAPRWCNMQVTPGG